MSYTTIYYYGLLFSFIINTFVFYLNIYHNDNVKKSQYSQMLLLHYIFLLMSWGSIALYVVSFSYLFIKDNIKTRKKK